MWLEKKMVFHVVRKKMVFFLGCKQFFWATRAGDARVLPDLCVGVAIYGIGVCSTGGGT